MYKVLRFSIICALLLLTAAAFIVAIELRWQALVFFNQHITVWQSVLLYLPSASFYLGLGLWFMAMALPVFANSLLRHLLLVVFMLLVLGFDTLASAILKEMGDGVSLFSIYYLLTQFNLLSASYTVFKGIFIALIPGIFLVFSGLKYYRLWLLRQRQGVALLSTSLLILFASFIPFSSQSPKSVSLSPVVYALSSLDKAPRASDFSIVPTPQAMPTYSQQTIIEEKPNIALIILESTRKDAISLYNKTLMRKTPFFDALAKRGLVFENMYSTVPFTIKTLTSANCGINPYFNFPIMESSYGLPADCLAHWLENSGYSSVFMQSAHAYHGNKAELTKQWGITEVFSAEELDGDGLKTNVFGFQEEALLPKNAQWLDKVDQPFFASYLTLAPHWPYNFYNKEEHIDYVDSDTPTNIHNFSALFNEYLSTVYQQDQFLELLIQQFKDSGHYENTIFIFMADHGESFGEHRHFQHANNLYQESINVPFMIYSPNFLHEQGVSDAMLSQIDMPQIISNLLSGKPALDTIDNESVFSACWFWQWCIARVDLQYKYIHNFDDAKDELYDLQRDPQEQNNIIDQHEELGRQFRQESLAWYREQLAMYAQHYEKQDKHFYRRGHPRLGDP